MGAIVFIYGISFLQGTIFALIVLISKFYRSRTNRYLAFTILVISAIGLMNGIEEYLGDSKIFLFEVLNIVPLEMLFPATFFTYIYLKSNAKFLSGKLVFLYIPFYLFSIANITIVLLDAYGLIAGPGIRSAVYLLFDVEYFFILVCSFLIGIFCFVLVGKAAHLEEASKKWLKYLIAIYFVLVALWELSELYNILTDKESVYMEYALWVGVTTFFYWVSYKGLIRFKLLEDRYEITQIIKSGLPKEQKKPKKDTANIHFQKLEALMQTEHAYLDSNLNRENIADRIGISPGYLSKIINHTTKDNFSEYVNSYRVDAVKNMIQNPEFGKYSLLAIGYESGFTSKTGFYNAFKQRTGMTPNAYKTKMNKS